MKRYNYTPQRYNYTQIDNESQVVYPGAENQQPFRQVQDQGYVG